MRNVYIVSYDISDSVRLRRVHKKLLGYGDPLQYSVFRCVLSISEKIILVESLLNIINQRADQVMFIDIGPFDGRSWERVETFGKALNKDDLDKQAVII